MKYLWFILFILLLNSCVTYKRCVQKFGVETKIDTLTQIQVDTFEIKERIIDTVTKRLPGEILKVTDTIPCPELISKKFTGKSIKGSVEVNVNIDSNRISVECKTDSLIEVLHIKEREISTLKTQIITIKEQNRLIDNRSWIEKIPWWVIPIILLLLSIILVALIKKR